MGLIGFFIQRKVTVAMLLVTLFLFGAISWFRMDQELMPELDFPQLTVITTYANASSKEVENLLTKAVEEAAGTVKNVRRIRSVSREGVSVVTVEFQWGTNMDLASLNLREKVDLAKAKLPRDSGEPRIEKFNPFAMPVITLSLSGDLPDKELLAVARRPVTELLEKCRGVAAVSLTGGREREILVELDQSKLTARGLSIMDVAQSISRANLTYPAGSVKDNKLEYVVRVVGAFEKVQDLNNIAVSMDHKSLTGKSFAASAKNVRSRNVDPNALPQPITLGSIATVSDGEAELSSISRYNGKANIALSILKQAESNVVRVAQEVRDKIPEIRAKLPPGVRLDLVYDQSVFVSSGIMSMVMDCLLGGLLSVAVLVLFLGEWRDALTVSMAIPISIFTCFMFMQMKGLTINTITLAGLAIGIGMLVDGAVVVQENIARCRGLGRPLYEAAMEGSSEVLPAVAGSVLTTIAVFIPFIFISGVIGQLFQSLCWSVVYSHSAALITLPAIPALYCALGSKSQPNSKPAWWLSLQNRGTRWQEKYLRFLNLVLDRPWRAIGWTMAALGASVIVLSILPRTLFPAVEGDQIIARLEMPVGTSLEVTDKVATELERVIGSLDEGKKQKRINNIAVIVGSLPREGLQPLGKHQAQLVLDLDTERSDSSSRIAVELKQKIGELSLQGGKLFFMEQEGQFSLMGSGEAPVVVEVKGNDLDKLEKTANDLAAQLRLVKGLENVNAGVSEPAPELQLEVKREALSNLSLSVSQLSESILTAIQGKSISKFREQGKEVDIRLRLRPEDRNNIDAIHKLYVHSPLEVDVPVGSVATVRKGKGPSVIRRYDQERSILVTADLQGRSLDAAADDIQKVISQVQKDPEVRLFLTGQSKQMAESYKSLKIVLLLSILFVFMIMAAEFENLWQPTMLLTAVPLSLIGMALGLALSATPISAMAGMGLVLLGGIVVDNGIVLVEFVNSELDKGMSVRESLIYGCRVRLRPILMTASTTILGMIPLALGIGQGAQIQAPMARVVVCGLFVSTVLTLLVLPAIFLVTYENLINPRLKRTA